MPSTTKSNRLKRKRGKKFVWQTKTDEETSKKNKEKEVNPFEEHSKSKKFTRDLEKRQEMLQEFRKLGNNSQLIDNRIAERSSKLSEDDKMKLRYIAEQRDRAINQLNTKTTRKRAKFNLDSDDDNDDGDVFFGGGFTHKGKPIEDEDDFNEQISLSSDEESPEKGKLTEEMVNTMNFGGEGHIE